MATMTRQSMIDQVLAEKQANVVQMHEILAWCTQVADRALAQGDEPTRWAVDAEAMRAVRAFTKISANLDRMLERLEQA